MFMMSQHSLIPFTKSMKSINNRQALAIGFSVLDSTRFKWLKRKNCAQIRTKPVSVTHSYPIHDRFMTDKKLDIYSIIYDESSF